MNWTHERGSWPRTPLTHPTLLSAVPPDQYPSVPYTRDSRVRTVERYSTSTAEASPLLFALPLPTVQVWLAHHLPCEQHGVPSTRARHDRHRGSGRRVRASR